MMTQGYFFPLIQDFSSTLLSLLSWPLLNKLIENSNINNPKLDVIKTINLVKNTCQL